MPLQRPLAVTDRRTLLARLALLSATLWAGGARASTQEPGPVAAPAGPGVAPSGPPGADMPLPLTAVAEGVFVYRAPYELVTPANQGAIANMTVVVGSEAAAVIDTGNSYIAGARMLAAVRVVTDRPLRYVINTHMHPDHTLGNAAFVGSGVTFVAHRKMPRALSMRADTYLAQVERLLGAAGEGTRIVLPDLLVENEMTLDLGGRALMLRAHPTAHTDNDLSVRDSRTKSWILGDLLFVGHIPTLDGSLNGWLELLTRLTDESAPRVIPGHGPASVDWPAGALPEQAYLARLREEVRALITSGGGMADAPAAVSRDGVPPGDPASARAWALADEFQARNAIAAFHELEWE